MWYSTTQIPYHKIVHHLNTINFFFPSSFLFYLYFQKTCFSMLSTNFFTCTIIALWATWLSLTCSFYKILLHNFYKKYINIFYILPPSLVIKCHQYYNSTTRMLKKKRHWKVSKMNLDVSKFNKCKAWVLLTNFFFWST
jgi:hypothetical protein